jgi:glycosyltransferase involved in cell wall biosynthesis
MAKKILLLSTRDSYGGSAEWMYNAALMLHNNGHEVALLVAEKHKNDEFIYQVPTSQKKKSIPQRLINYIFHKLGLKSSQVKLKTKPEYSFFQDEDETQKYFSPDIILVGLTYKFVNYKTLFELTKVSKSGVYLVVLDMSTFTGGCHVVNTCRKFTDECNNCPGVLIGDLNYTKQNLLIKKELATEGNFKVLYGSGWGLEQANKSVVTKNLQKIFMGSCVDTTLYTNKNRSIAKKIFDIETSSKVIFAGSESSKDKRKGWSFLVESLSQLYTKLNDKDRNNTLILLTSKYIDKESFTNEIPFSTKFIDYVTDNRLLSLVYQASDIFLCTSIEDLGPVMVTQALSSGTPVVGFKMGLLYDDSLVTDFTNGYRANLGDTISLTEGMEYFLKNSESEFQIASKNARDAVIKKSSGDFFVSVIEEL